MERPTITQESDGYYKVIYPKTTNTNGRGSVLGIHKCPVCNDEFEIFDRSYRYHKGLRYFCSYSCMSIYKRTK